MKRKRKNPKYVYDPTEWDESKGVFVKAERKKAINELSTSIRLPVSMVNKLRKVASRKGEIGYQTLIKIWIAERLEKELVTCFNATHLKSQRGASDLIANNTCKPAPNLFRHMSHLFIRGC